MNTPKRTVMAIGLICFLGFTPAIATAATGFVTGTVSSIEDGAPLAAAFVTIDGLGLSTVTDVAGEFSLDGVPVGKHQLKITCVGFQSVQMTVAVRDGETTSLVVRLQPETAPSDEAGKPQTGSTALGDPNYTSKDKQTREAEKRQRPLISLPFPSLQEGYSGSNYQGDRMQTSPGVPKPIAPGGCYREPPDYSYGPYDMFFRDYGTNNFVDTRQDRLSTFAIDVDDASFNIVKRYLIDGYLPPRDAVRIEEFINHFDYGYATPDHKRFRIFYETTDSPFDRRITMLKIGIKGAEITRRERDPLNLTFVIDVSGSMGYDNRLELVKESLRMLVNQLTNRDRIGIVAYGSQARVVLQPTGIERRNDILRAINSLRPGGSTYAEAGLKRGYNMANSQYVSGHSNRIILCSDGVANVGQVSPDAIMAQVNRYANKGITLSTFGYGMGNYNDVLLEKLAQKGNGKYAYVNDLREAEKLFVSDFVGSMQVLARDVKVQIDFNPEIVRSYRLIGYENRDVADNRFRDNRQDGGEIGAGHEVTALYELILHDSRRRADVAAIAVRYTDPDRGEVTEVNQNVSLDRKSLGFRESRPELRLAIVASRFGELLKGTVYASETGFEELYQMARSLTEELGGEQTRELADLILRARDLSTYHTRR